MNDTGNLSSKEYIISTVEAHAGGEPLRVITSGFPPLSGKTMLEKRRQARAKWDFLRTALMWEPRGHADMYGAIITNPVTADGDLGVLFLHNEGFSTMCGHGIIALTTVVLETEMIPRLKGKSTLHIDTPAGRVTSRARIKNGRVQNVSFTNVPSFAVCLGEKTDIPGLGQITYDIAFGGAFYAFCDAEKIGLELTPGHIEKLIHMGRSIKKTVAGKLPLIHPGSKDLGYLYGTIFIGPPLDPSHHSRNVCIFAEGEVDRSPTGTGVSARAALLYARKELKLNQNFTVESIIGTCFEGRIMETGRLGSYKTVIPEVTGSAHITGRSTFQIDPRDPLRFGFILR
ncbi:MAG: proline racemase family protein [Candidatus Aminicenantes bacterium]|nr:proline racemase family protein [Candidatus Aminicenantes bacterium]